VLKYAAVPTPSTEAPAARDRGDGSGRRIELPDRVVAGVDDVERGAVGAEPLGCVERRRLPHAVGVGHDAGKARHRRDRPSVGIDLADDLVPRIGDEELTAEESDRVRTVEPRALGVPGAREPGVAGQGRDLPCSSQVDRADDVVPLVGDIQGLPAVGAGGEAARAGELCGREAAVFEAQGERRFTGEGRDAPFRERHLPQGRRLAHHEPALEGSDGGGHGEGRLGASAILGLRQAGLARQGRDGAAPISGGELDGPQEVVAPIGDVERPPDPGDPPRALEEGGRTDAVLGPGVGPLAGERRDDRARQAHRANGAVARVRDVQDASRRIGGELLGHVEERRGPGAVRVANRDAGIASPDERREPAVVFSGGGRAREDHARVGVDHVEDAAGDRDRGRVLAERGDRVLRARHLIARVDVDEADGAGVVTHVEGGAVAGHPGREEEPSGRALAVPLRAAPDAACHRGDHPGVQIEAPQHAIVHVGDVELLPVAGREPPVVVKRGLERRTVLRAQGSWNSGDGRHGAGRGIDAPDDRVGRVAQVEEAAGEREPARPPQGRGGAHALSVAFHAPAADPGRDRPPDPGDPPEQRLAGIDDVDVVGVDRHGPGAIEARVDPDAVEVARAPGLPGIRRDGAEERTGGVAGLPQDRLAGAVERLAEIAPFPLVDHLVSAVGRHAVTAAGVRDDVAVAAAVWARAQATVEARAPIALLPRGDDAAPAIGEKAAADRTDSLKRAAGRAGRGRRAPAGDAGALGPAEHRPGADAIGIAVARARAGRRQTHGESSLDGRLEASARTAARDDQPAVGPEPLHEDGERAGAAREAVGVALWKDDTGVHRRSGDDRNALAEPVVCVDPELHDRRQAGGGLHGDDRVAARLARSEHERGESGACSGRHWMK
jgi:hypothetical protein